MTHKEKLGNNALPNKKKEEGLWCLVAAIFFVVAFFSIFGFYDIIHKNERDKARAAVKLVEMDKCEIYEARQKIEKWMHRNIDDPHEVEWLNEDWSVGRYLEYPKMAVQAAIPAFSMVAVVPQVTTIHLITTKFRITDSQGVKKLYHMKFRVSNNEVVKIADWQRR